ncbi:protein-L-isoaspartate O-methyltransferase [Rhodoferax lithotrophicus]|uniref:Protein-L-isoaspartate O-methyltransferase n=1 Tax=Rhodoferax lithotrophicus TaxID=2798804 RepID=A0ABM7MKG5_9BURK|nr:protein-L-isoaspartate O-methyltransferase [Rhodoferax sp. MIZ03]BCO26738.1 protein-L-isoaspartate O-methyltransferase [Rhodoferax sp. MIZ03]
MNLQNVEQARYYMIEQQIRPWDVSDDAVIELLTLVKREDFVPLAQKSLAFVDMAIALPGDQSMLPPRVQARLLQDAAVTSTDKVLEIGTGTGFMTAILARQSQRVISLEINPELAEMAQSNLQRAGIHNVEIRQADGSKGTLADAPFDVIVLGGSVAEVPKTLLDMLKVGGRLVGIVGEEPIMHAQTITRTSETNFTVIDKWDDNAPRLVNFPQPSAFKF